MKRIRVGSAVIGLLAVVVCATCPAAAQNTKDLRFARILGINFLPNYVMESNKLVEKHSQVLGVPNLHVEWRTVGSGGAATDAMLAGGVDVVSVGPGNLLLLWDRTRGGVKGIVSNSALPAVLISRDPRLTTIHDISSGDRIAVPTVGVSTQAILLQMQAVKLFGQENWKKFDGNTVQLGHSDAYAALMNSRHEVQSHFASPPFIARELKNVPGAHIVLTSRDVLGTPLSTAILFTTTKFADDNPKLIQAVRLASQEAIELIHKDPQKAAHDYLMLSGDRMPVDELVEMLKDPEMRYDVEPEGTMKFAEHLARTGLLRTKPNSWTDYFLPMAADLGGN